MPKIAGILQYNKFSVRRLSICMKIILILHGLIINKIIIIIGLVYKMFGTEAITLLQCVALFF